MPARPRRAALLTCTALLALVALVAAACGGQHGAHTGAASRPSTVGARPSTSITVFAAASLTAAFAKLEGDFTRAHPDIEVTYEFAGSQTLATQLQSGAPADVFASADQASMATVAGLVDDPQVLARNVLELVVAKGNPKRVRGLADLARPDLKVVLGAPDVPAGRYARQALDAQQVTVTPVSLEDDVKAVVAKVALGEADAGVVYATDVTAAGDAVDGVDLPASQNVTATYPIAVVEAGRHRQAAQAFVDFARSGRGQQLLQAFGFLPAASS